MDLVGDPLPVYVDAHLREIRAFVTVADHLHFSRAAQALYLSQPALSKQIRSLERLLRVELFTRDRRNVLLTPAGQALLPGARATLTAWSHAQRAVADAVAASTSELVIGISLGVERGLVPLVRKHLATFAPQATLRLRRLPWADQTSGLTSPARDVDAAFVWLPLPEPHHYEWLSIAIEDRWLLMPSRHRLAGRTHVAFDEITQEAFLALPADAGLARDFWLANDARERPAPIAGVASSTEELVEALIAGVGVCLIAEGNLDAFHRHDIAASRVTGLAPSEMVLAWRRGDDRNLLRLLVAAVERAVRELSTS